MSFSPLVMMFVAVFLAELGDKTQLATVLFAADGEHNPWVVFLVASLALVASTAIAVLLGTLASKYLAVAPLKLIAGIGFVLLGGWTIFDHFR
jgi:putative Ca2+/H+ antiporter (TMEM165/GDT1 family)